ncbi:MAG: hypothetical protein LBB85_11655 [Dysgonamonadaceae bacterium]|jgi:hypothetical protein|nr:hypothetical protein [Dysgonamonadaceae bacterium]
MKTWKEYRDYGCLQWLLLWVVLAAGLFLFSCCCSTKTAVSESRQEDRFAEVSKKATDSVYVSRYDSIFIRETGDTVFIDKYHIRTDYRLRVDTVSVRDSIYIDTGVFEVKEVNRLSIWQTVEVWCGRLLLVAVVLVVVYGLFKGRSNDGEGAG